MCKKNFKIINLWMIMTQKHEINKLVKKWYDYFISTVNSDDYKNFCIEDDKRLTDNYLASIADEPVLSHRTDFQSDSKIAKLTICDMVDNNAFTKLINRIHNLSDKEFKVDCKYRNSTLFRKYDYVHLNFYGSGYGYLGEIKFLKDPYISSIEILSSQINNYFAIVEYIFYFKKGMDDDLSNDFICYNIPKLTRKDYKPYYYFFKDDTKTSNYAKVRQAQSELFPVICQHYITTLLYSENGQQGKLPSLSFFNRKASINIDTFAGTQFGKILYNKKQNFIVEEDFESNTFRLYSGDNKLPRLCISEMIFRYGNKFYFVFLGRQFIKNFELTYSKYVSRKRITNNELLKLLKFYYGLSDDSIFCHPRDLISDFNKDWELYFGYDKAGFASEALQVIEQYKSIFHNVYEHCKTQTDIKTSKTGRIISYCALGISFISVVLSLILNFC